MSPDESTNQGQEGDVGAEATFHLLNNTDEMARLDRAVEEFGQVQGWSEQMSYHIKLALEEVVMNVISYAYEDDGVHEFEVKVRSDSDGVVIDVIDDGQPFDPLHEAAEPDVEATLEARNIGGLGVFFVKTLMDEVEYRREDDRNRLTLTKRNTE